MGTIARNFVLYHCVKEIKNFEQHRNFLSDMHQNLIRTKLYQDATEYKVSSVSFISSWETVCTKFWRHNTYIQTFSKYDQFVFKTCKSIENRISKTFPNPILSSYALEESKNESFLNLSYFNVLSFALSCFIQKTICYVKT